MSKENDVIELEDAVEVPEFNPTQGTDWKAQAEANLELAKRNAGIAQRNKTKLQKLKEARVETTPTLKNEPQSNDLGEKAYLISNGIKGSEEIEFVQKMKKETGRDVESLLETTYFQTELKEFREKKTTANAIPTSSKRSSNSQVDSVEYWIAKGELPPASEVTLRRDVVNARMAKEKNVGQFYNS